MSECSGLRMRADALKGPRYSPLDDPIQAGQELGSVAAVVAVHELPARPMHRPTC